MAFRNFETSLHWLHQSLFLRRAVRTRWFHRFRLLIKSLKQFRPCRCPIRRKWIRMAFNHRFNDQQIRILRRSEDRIEFPGPFVHLN
jgi:hypothetical protein